MYDDEKSIATEQVRQSELKSEIVRLHGDVEELDSLASQLRSKLSPVLRNTPEISAGSAGLNPESQPQTEYGQGLRDASNRVRSTAMEIRVILQKLEV